MQPWCRCKHVLLHQFWALKGTCPLGKEKRPIISSDSTRGRLTPMVVLPHGSMHVMLPCGSMVLLGSTFLYCSAVHGLVACGRVATAGTPPAVQGGSNTCPCHIGKLTPRQETVMSKFSLHRHLGIAGASPARHSRNLRHRVFAGARLNRWNPPIPPSLSSAASKTSGGLKT